jgi:hypothetical protein
MRMAFIHRAISATVLAVALTAAWGAAGPAQAQQPGSPILHPGAVGGASGARPAVGVGVGHPAIGAGVGQTGIGGHNFNARIVRPPNLGAGIARPTINPNVAQPLGIGRVGGLHNQGFVGGLHNRGLPAGGSAGAYQPYYHHHLHGGHYGHYRLAPFDYPNIVPEYSGSDYSYGYGAPYSDYQGTCRVRWVKVRVRVHHHYQIRRVRRRICW